MVEQTSYKFIVIYRFLAAPSDQGKTTAKRTCKKTNDYTNDVDDDNSEGSVPQVGQFVDPQIPRPVNRQTIKYFNKVYNVKVPWQSLKNRITLDKCVPMIVNICREVHGKDHLHLDIFLVKMCLAGNE